MQRPATFEGYSSSYPVVLEQVRQWKPTKSTLADGLIRFLPAKHPGGDYLFRPAPTPGRCAVETISFLDDDCKSVVRREEYACDVLQLCLLRKFWAILKQDVCRGRLVATSEGAFPALSPEGSGVFQHRSTACIDEGRGYVREDCNPIWCHLPVSLNDSR